MAARRSRMATLLGVALMIGLLGATIGVTLGAHRWKQDLRVRAVEIVGTRVVSQEEILKLAAIRPDTGLFDIDLRAVQERVASQVYIERVAVSRNVPDGIIIEITEREPVAILPAGKLLAIDAQGRVLPAAWGEALFDLPVLTGIPAAEMVPGRQAGVSRGAAGAHADSYGGRGW